MNLQNRNRFTDLENELMVANRKGEGVWDGHVHTALFKTDNQQEPTAQHREVCSMSCGSLNGKRILRIGTCICMAEYLCYSSETITTLLISYTPMQDKKLKKKERKKWPIWFYRSKPKDLQWIELSSSPQILGLSPIFFFFPTHSLQTSACSPTPHLQVINCCFFWAPGEIKRRLLLGRKFMTNLDSILKSRHYIVNKGPSSQGYGFSSGHVWM